uniref:Death domain-containing protein n=1 Tax=Panagrolaimus sp. JU765 TaxID=591449 RepID=A0AC34RJF7_9BILA
MDDDETALICAASRGHLECVQCLVESGANVDTVDANQQTALHLALRRSHIDIALYLISKECNINCRDLNDDTPLHIGCRLGLNSVIQMLCHLGAEVDVVNKNKETPLHIAAKEGHVEIVRCLCFVGANVLAKNRDGLTPEILAITKEHQQIAQLLGKVKNESQRSAFVSQLCPAENQLRRIKLKIFGNSQSGKSKLIQGIQGQGVFGNLINAVSRRFSDNSKGNSDEGIHSCASSSASTDSADRSWPLNYQRPTHPNYTRGIDVLTMSLPSGEEFSCWEFGGFEPYHIAYDHFVGNTDCIHIITIRADEPTEIQYKQALYWMNFLKGRPYHIAYDHFVGNTDCIHIITIRADEPTEIQYKQALYWMNFLKGRVTPSEPIQHRGIIARRSKVVIVATNATPSLLTQNNGFEKQPDGNFTNSDADAMMKTIRLRFESHFDIHEKLLFVDSASNACQGMKIFKHYLQETREELLGRLQRPLVLLDACISYLATLRKRYQSFPVIMWLHFTTLIRDEVNPLASDSHCQQLIHQLQLIGEVVYIRDERAEIDYVVITPEWLGTHVIGTILSADFLSQCRESGCYSADDFIGTFPEISEPTDLMNILDTLHLCSPIDPQDAASNAVFEFPAFILAEPPRDRLQRPLVLLDACISYLATLRKRYQSFPVIMWLHFTTLIRDEVNPLASDSHCQQLIHQLQLIGEVVYIRDERAEIDYVVITPEWLGTHVIGTILSADFLSQCRESGCYSADDFIGTFPEISEPTDLMNILDTLHLCSPIDPQDAAPNAVFEFPAFILAEPPRDVWSKDKAHYVYGGVRILPMRGMESTLQSTFSRLQVALRNQLHDYRDPGKVSLQQWQGLSKLISNKMESLVRLSGDAIEVLVRGPQKMAPSCIYFLEDIVGVIEQTTAEIAPGMSLERHFLSPKHLKDHVTNPASFPPEVIMAMQQNESLSIINSDGNEELFTDVVCFGSREVAAMLTLGIDMSVSQLSMTSRCELAALLDPPDAMGRDWSILAVKLNLTETLPEVDSTGQSISQTDQIISEWSIKCPESATVGKLCAILEQLGRTDARDILYRTVPLYVFAPLDEVPVLNQTQLTSQRDTNTSIADSGVLLSSAPRSSSTLSN